MATTKKSARKPAARKPTPKKRVVSQPPVEADTTAADLPQSDAETVVISESPIMTEPEPPGDTRPPTEVLPSSWARPFGTTSASYIDARWGRIQTQNGPGAESEYFLTHPDTGERYWLATRNTKHAREKAVKHLIPLMMLEPDQRSLAYGTLYWHWMRNRTLRSGWDLTDRGPKWVGVEGQAEVQRLASENPAPHPDVPPVADEAPGESPKPWF